MRNNIKSLQTVSNITPSTTSKQDDIVTSPSSSPKPQNGMKKRNQSSNTTSKKTQNSSSTISNKTIYKKNILIHKRNNLSSNTFSSPGFKRSYTATSFTPFQENNNNQYSINYFDSKLNSEYEAPPSPMKTTYGFKKHNTFDSVSLPSCASFQNDMWPMNTIERYIIGNSNSCNMHKTVVLNLEEILLLEMSLTEIAKCINNGIPCQNECFDYWNFFYNSSLSNDSTKFTSYFPDQSKDIIERCIHLELLSVILCYDLSYYDDNFTQLRSHLKTLMQLHYSNLILICNYFLSKIISPNENNMWINKLATLIQIHYNVIQTVKVNSLHQININNNAISDLHRIIIKNYNNPNLTDDLIFLSKKINQLNLETLNHFYREKVIRVTNCNRSILASSTNQHQKDLLSQNRTLIKIPYLNQESIKSYTLVLDLDETLVHFKENQMTPSKGILHLRPGLLKFLETVSIFYELVVFTAATKEYADPILEAIEKDKIIFEYKLYREHTVIVGEDFVKDVSRLGRDLSKVIIVDNMPQCFRLQKDNGIFIKPFYGKDANDHVLMDLAPILLKIAENRWDVRNGLKHFKDEIVNKVTGGFYRNDEY